jgi:hypothetical protein
VIGLPNGPVFKAKQLRIIEPYVKTIDFIGANGIAYFFGDNVRGAVTGIKA